jgi:VanZ family protein
MKDWVKRWGPAILIMALIFGASATPGSDLPKFGFFDIFVKKGGHMFGYALLAAAFFHALNQGRNITLRQFFAAVCLAAIYAATDECHQLFTPERNSSLVDIAIDAFGSIAGLGLWCLFRAYLWDPHRSTQSSGKG